MSQRFALIGYWRRVASITAAVVAMASTLIWPSASAQGPAQCGPGSIGLARTHQIDTTGGPRFGANQYPGREFLAPGEVVLTFDDGPHPAYTQPILNTLAQHCTLATFFMVGQRAIMYPEIVREVARRGHTIATHTWSHQNQAQLGGDAARTEMELGISAVQKAFGAPAAPFFRFPYLSDPQSSQAYLRSRNTGIFSIDVDTHDYKTRSPTVVIRNVMQQLQQKGRGIILFHDIQPSTVGALDQLLRELKAKGFKVVHIAPQRGQVTVAEYDKRIDGMGNSRRIASLPVPVSQRGVVNPAWEARMYGEPGRQPTILGPAGPATTPAAAPAPAPIPSPRPSRRDSDWRGNVFGGN